MTLLDRELLCFWGGVALGVGFGVVGWTLLLIAMGALAWAP